MDEDMKAKELMIGDWVQDIIPVVIDAISNEDICTYRTEHGYITANPSNLKPIPLTAEILEKNRFYYDETRKVYLIGAIFQIKPEKLGLFSFEICGCPYPLNTVHELQHVLRLCGIEKEIIL